MKYSILLNEKKVCPSKKSAFRIVAERDIFDETGKKLVSKGEKGGFVESEENLSQDGSCWIFGDAMVYNDAKVLDDALVFDNALIGLHSKITGSAKVYNNANIAGTVRIEGHAVVCDNATIEGSVTVKDYAVIRENVVVSGNAIIKNYAMVKGHATVKGAAVIKDYATVNKHACVSGNAVIENYAIISGIVSDDANIKSCVVVEEGGNVSKQSVVTGSFTVKSGVSICIDKKDIQVGTNPYDDEYYRCSIYSGSSVVIHESNYHNLFITPISSIGCFTYLRNNKNRASIFISESIISKLRLPISINEHFSNKEELWSYFVCLLKEKVFKEGLEKCFADYFVSLDYKTLCNITEKLSDNFMSGILKAVKKEKIKKKIREKSDLIMLRAENYFFGYFIEFILYLLNPNEKKINYEKETFINWVLENSMFNICKNMIFDFPNSIFFNESLLRMVENTCDVCRDSYMYLLYTECEKNNFIKLQRLFAPED